MLPGTGEGFVNFLWFDLKKGCTLGIITLTAPLFLSIGMHCLGCPSSRGETVEEACMVHGVDPDALLEELNKMVKD